MIAPFQHPAVARLVRLALEEDIGRGDLTTASTLRPGERASARVTTREGIIAAGLPIAEILFREYGATVDFAATVAEGAAVRAGGSLLSVSGEAIVLLELERTLLNFLQRMCGIATTTKTFVDAASGTNARITDTRKTIPGWRLLDKYAVRVGGGTNHRFGLDDGILLKDNHVAAAGGIGEAVTRARARAPHLLRVEVECEQLDQVTEALEAGADAVLLDNMDTETMRAAVARVREHARPILVEASGGITLEKVPEIAGTGVDLISVGAVTHSARAVDLTMHLVT